MSTYGIDNFYISEIEKVSGKTKKILSDILDDREIYWVSFYDTYKNGYNETPGGQKNAPNKFPERAIFEYSINGVLLNTYPSLTAASDVTGYSRSDINSCCLKTKVYRVRNKIFRYVEDSLTENEIIWYKNKYPKIHQYDFNGNLINEYEFVSDAERYLNSMGIMVDSANISNCCKGVVGHAYGYVWRYGSDAFDAYKLPWNKKIEQRDLATGDLINIFESFNEICNTYGFDKSSINQCCLGHFISSYGYHWCYEGEFNGNNLDRRTRNRTIDKYSIDGKYIGRFFSVNDAGNNIGHTNPGALSSIRSVCNGNHKTAFGYIWRYSGDPFDYNELLLVLSKRNGIK